MMNNTSQNETDQPTDQPQGESQEKPEAVKRDGENQIQRSQDLQGNTMATPAAIVIGFGLVAAAIYFGPYQPAQVPTGDFGNNNAPTPAAPQVPQQPQQQADPNARVDVGPGDMPILGDPGAPVLVVEWSDYQCPFCGRFFNETEPQIIEEYVNTGKVQFAYRDFAFLGPESIAAAVAGRCANEQGKFWEYHDALFEAQNGENQGTFEDASLKSIAANLGLNTGQFNSCLDSRKYEDDVTADTSAGREAGVSGTPTTFINGRKLEGAQPYVQFKTVIDEELASAGE